MCFNSFLYKSQTASLLLNLSNYMKHQLTLLENCGSTDVSNIHYYGTLCYSVILKTLRKGTDGKEGSAHKDIVYHDF